MFSHICYVSWPLYITTLTLTKVVKNWVVFNMKNRISDNSLTRDVLFCKLDGDVVYALLGG